MEKEIRKRIREGILSAAEEHGMSLTDACDRIELTLRCGLKSSVPEVRAFWRRIPTEGNHPTAEEIVGYLTAIYIGLID